MKKLIITLFLLLTVTLGSQAQKYVVYTIVGKPSIVTQTGKRLIELREELQPTSKIIMPYEARLELFDIENKDQIIIKTNGSSTVAGFMKNKQNEKLKPSERYLKYILSRIKGNEETVVRSCSDPATVTRQVQKQTGAYKK